MTEVDDDQTPPKAIEEDAAGISTELPVVVFGDEDDVAMSSERPRVRVLPGRVHERFVLYPIYALDLIAGLVAARFASSTTEWSTPVIGLAWFLLFVWYWFYGIAYRYRRRVLKYTSVLVIIGLTAALSYFSIERAQPQMAMIGPGELVQRDAAGSLYVSAGAAMLALGILTAHLIFLGRGYRQKK